MIVKDIREELGLSKKEAAEIVNIPIRTWDKWESGERKPAPYLEKLIVFYLKHRELDLEERQ